LKQVVDVRRTA